MSDDLDKTLAANAAYAADTHVDAARNSQADDTFVDDDSEPSSDRTMHIRPDSEGGDDPYLDPLAPRMRNSADRYRDFSRLGEGGIGVVRACLDPNLGREVAMKILHPKLQDEPEQRIRFMREARIMAQIEHPNVLPIHELGMREGSGTIYFTMKKIDGVTLKHVFERLRQGDAATIAAYPLARMIEAFLHICQGVAFAHSRHIIHRDLKPANILLGAFGEVLVMDWGMAKVLRRGADANLSPVTADHTGMTGDMDLTIEGSVSGTPLYMSPEQACGLVADLDERSDIYALGAMLYEMLTWKQSVGGAEITKILEKIIKGEIEPPRQRAPERHVAKELEAICLKAMNVSREARYRSVGELIADVEAWRLGWPVSVYRDPIIVRFWKHCKRHPVIASTLSVGVAVVALTVTVVLVGVWQRSDLLLRRGDLYRLEGNAANLQQIAVWDELDSLRRETIDKSVSTRESELMVTLAERHLEAENNYQLAKLLYIDAGDFFRGEQRRAALGEMFRNRLNFAIRQRDWAEAGRLLEMQVDDEKLHGNNSVSAEELGAAFQAVEGDGTLVIETIGGVAQVTLFRLEPDSDGVIVPVEPRDLGTTPIARIRLKKGSYLARLTVADRPEVSLPICIDHGEDEVNRVTVPRSVPDGMVYVPAGRFYMGGEAARHNRLHQRQVEGFFIARQEITFGEYIEYWLATRTSPNHADDMSRIRLRRNERNFINAWDDNGQLVAPLRNDLPLVGIEQDSARRYCEWRSQQLGRTVRLPTEAEWEKAARGVDGREFVWGDTYNVAFSYILENNRAREAYGFWAPPGKFPRDVSIYGAADMEGNVREWTSSLFPGDSPFYIIKGASASTTRRFLNCSYSSDTAVVPSDVGFRILMPLDPAIDVAPAP